MIKNRMGACSKVAIETPNLDVVGSIPTAHANRRKELQWNSKNINTSKDSAQQRLKV